MCNDIVFARVEREPELVAFLVRMDREFPHPLSSKCDLSVYASKLLTGGIVEGAWEGDELLGILAGYANDLGAREAYISALVVDPRYRGRRISSKLLSNFEDDARKAGMDSSRVFTYKTNAAAFGLYTAHGYQTVGLHDNGDYELLKRF